MNLSKKVVFISGASDGIGAEAARQFAAAGAVVVLAARTISKLERIAEQIRAGSGTALAVELDVCDINSVNRAVERTLQQFGRIDILINNAGNGGHLDLFMDADIEQTKAMYEVHVFGAERMTRAVLPAMLRQKSGRIVMVASAVAYVPMPGAAAYCSAKAAVLAMAQVLRGELAGSGVEIACFSPPHTQTEAGKNWPLNMPKEFSVEFAAKSMVGSVKNDKLDYLAGGNGSLLFLQKLSPRLAHSIMQKIGMDAVRKVKAAKSTA